MPKVRSFLSVLLVCCLLVNVVPVKSKAAAVEAGGVVSHFVSFNSAASGAVFGPQVFASALLGLGIAVTAVQAMDLMEKYVEYSGEVETSIYYFPDGSWSYGVDVSFLDRVRAFLFDTGVLSESVCSYIGSASYWDDTILIYHPTYRFAISYYDLTRNKTYYYDCCVIYGSTGYTESGKTYDTYDSFSYTDASGKSKACGLLTKSVSSSYGCVYVGEFEDSFSGITSALEYAARAALTLLIGGNLPTGIGSEYELGVVAPSDAITSDGYLDWYSNARPAALPDTEDEIPIFPILFDPNSDFESLFDGVSQSDIWEGSITDSLPGTDTDTGTEVVPDTIGLSDIWQAIKSVPSAFEGWFTDLIDLAGEIGEAIIGLPARIKEALTFLFQDVVNVGQAVVDAVLGIPQAIADVLTAIFVPNQAYVEAKVDAVYAQFPFIQSIIATGEELKGAVSGSSGPPVIYVDLGLAPSGDFGSQKVLLTDFSWYEPYKQRVDTLLSAALWALFGWRMYLRLPSIISGEGGIMIASERAYRKLGDD